jgi:hypothetical protein
MDCKGYRVGLTGAIQRGVEEKLYEIVNEAVSSRCHCSWDVKSYLSLLSLSGHWRVA